ncbi:matrilin-3-like [Argopecten irradians]|uniref:matrilin-3-like n=1 Tax=Argopecten irradians TaxID=31199 RepID=UPI00371BCD4A
MARIQILLLCFSLTSTLASHCKMTDTSDHFTGYRISHGDFKTLTSIGIVGCQRECLKTPLCESVGYNKVTLECSMGLYQDAKTFTGLQTDIFIRPNASKLEILGPCRDRPCASNETCIRLSSGYHACIIPHHRPLDLAVIIDGSRTLTADDFNNVLDCIKYLVNVLFDIRLSVTVFNYHVTTAIYFDDFLNKADMLSGIDINVIYPDAVGNELGAALAAVQTNVFSQSRGDRVEAADIILVILSPDDMSTDNLDVSDSIKSSGINIITVAINAVLSAGMLVVTNITSEPIANYSIHVSSTGYIFEIYDDLVNIINNVP